MPRTTREARLGIRFAYFSRFRAALAPRSRLLSIFSLATKGLWSANMAWMRQGSIFACDSVADKQVLWTVVFVSLLLTIKIWICFKWPWIGQMNYIWHFCIVFVLNPYCGLSKWRNLKINSKLMMQGGGVHLCQAHELYCEPVANFWERGTGQFLPRSAPWIARQCGEALSAYLRSPLFYMDLKAFVVIH